MNEHDGGRRRLLVDMRVRTRFIFFKKCQSCECKKRRDGNVLVVVMDTMLASLSPLAWMKEVGASAATKIVSSYVNFSFSLWSSVFSSAAMCILHNVNVSPTKIVTTVCLAISISRVSFWRSASFK